MAKKIKRKKATKRSGPQKGVVYLTKRALVRAVTKGTKDVEAESISVAGYTVKEEDGWVVKQFASGEKERISRIHSNKKKITLKLD